MKKYLVNLADELDVVFTHLEGQEDWREEVIECIYKHLALYSDYAEGTLEKLLKDMEEGIAQ